MKKTFESMEMIILSKQRGAYFIVRSFSSFFATTSP